MARGGSRPNAGRKPGTPNKATAERQAEIEASGLTPLDHMLAVLRDADQPMDRRDWAAEKAAPYVHPRLAAVENKVSGSLAITEEPVDRPPREDRHEWEKRRRAELSAPPPRTNGHGQ